MELRPRGHEAQLPSRETAVDHLEVVDADLGLSLCVAGMEVWMPVVVEEHRDHDSEEAADRWHVAIMAPAGRRTRWVARSANLRYVPERVGLSDDPRRVTQETAPGPKARRGADLALAGSYYEVRLADLLERARAYGKAGCGRI